MRHHTDDVNVITINYEKFFGYEFTQYAKTYDYLVDTIVKLVKNLHQYGTLLDNVHVIGFGMSAHCIGSVAKVLHPLKVGRISGKLLTCNRFPISYTHYYCYLIHYIPYLGLDPSGIFDRFPQWTQLSSSDANFVDIISTNSHKYGTKFERGSVNFYPNGGEIQPGSMFEPPSSVICINF